MKKTIFLLSFILTIAVNAQNNEDTTSLFNNRDYPPINLPKWKPPKKITGDEYRLINHNISTKTDIIIDTIKHDGLLKRNKAEGNKGISTNNNIIKEKNDSKNFSTLSLISNPSSFPWCVNVKLYMSFSGGNAAASGVLIDSKHVLTAGHCVYDNENGWGWAHSITVVPAWNYPNEPFGVANATNFESFTGWTQNYNYDYDMGIITLDRPIGAITGWFGYGYNDDDNYFLTNTFNNPGYPVADCNYNAIYSGNQLYYWYGVYDNVYTDELEVNSMAYHGQSGSGSYIINSGNRYVYAELSNTSCSTHNDVRITGPKYNVISSIISGDTPSSFDLIPLYVQATPSSITSGNSLNSFLFYIHNYSSVSWSGNVQVNFYLSTNNIISSSDLLLNAGTYSINLSSKGTVCCSAPTITIPINTSAGYYYLGVILNINDYNTSNNNTSYLDVYKIYVGSSSGIEENSVTNEIKINPNPTSNNIIIETPKKSEIEILNVQGKLMKSFTAKSNKENMDVSFFPRGLYFVKVKTEKGVAVKKFVKE